MFCLDVKNCYVPVMWNKMIMKHITFYKSIQEYIVDSINFYMDFDYWETDFHMDFIYLPLCNETV